MTRQCLVLSSERGYDDGGRSSQPIQPLFAGIASAARALGEQAFARWG